MNELYQKGLEAIIRSRRIAVKPDTEILKRLTLDDDIVVRKVDGRLIYVQSVLRYVPKEEFNDVFGMFRKNKEPPLDLADPSLAVSDGILCRIVRGHYIYQRAHIEAIYITPTTAMALGLLQVVAKKTDSYFKYAIDTPRRRSPVSGISKMIMDTI